MSTHRLIKVSTYDELLEREQELLGRINGVENGGQLFLIDPLRLFVDIDVELSTDAREEFIRQHGGGEDSEAPYHALRASSSEQRTRVTMRGLFRRQP